jgi:hypothetical protein
MYRIYRRIFNNAGGNDADQAIMQAFLAEPDMFICKLIKNCRLQIAGAVESQSA